MRKSNIKLASTEYLVQMVQISVPVYTEVQSPPCELVKTEVCFFFCFSRDLGGGVVAYLIYWTNISHTIGISSLKMKTREHNFFCLKENGTL